MTVTVHIPDDLADRLRAQGGDLSRRILEMLALEEYKSGRLTKSELRQMLGFETSFQLDVFLKAHDVGLTTRPRTWSESAPALSALASDASGCRRIPGHLGGAAFQRCTNNVVEMRL